MSMSIGCHPGSLRRPKELQLFYVTAQSTIEGAQAIAAHESLRTTKLYDRTSDEITLGEIERIAI